MAGSSLAALKGWAGMTPEARTARLAKLAANRRVFTSEEAASNAKAAWLRPGYREAQSALRTGVPLTASTRARLSALRKGKARPASFGPKIAAHARARWAAYSSEEKARILTPAWRAMRGARPSSLECLVRAFLDEAQIEYATETTIGRYHPDLLFETRHLVIECDGWPHTFESQIEFDQHRDAELAQAGYRTVRLDEATIRSGQFKPLLLELLT